MSYLVLTVSISGLDQDSPQPQPWKSKIVAGNKVNRLYSQQLFRFARAGAGAGGCLDQDHISINTVFNIEISHYQTPPYKWFKIFQIFWNVLYTIYLIHWTYYNKVTKMLGNWSFWIFWNLLKRILIISVFISKYL